MIISVTINHIILLVMHFFLIIGGIVSYKPVAGSKNDYGIGLGIWFGVGILLEVLIWLIYGSMMYVFFT